MKRLLPILTIGFICSQSPAQINSFPYRENFDSVSAPTLPAGWMTTTNRNVTGDFITSTTTVRSIPNNISSTNGRISQSLISPVLDFSGKYPDSLTFYERRTSTHISGLLLEASVNGDTLFPISIGDTVKLVSSTSYVKRSFALPETLNNKSNVRFRWRVVADSSSGATGVIRFDDILLTLKKAIDLAITSFTISPPAPRSGDNLTTTIGITNKAQTGIFSFTVQLFDSLTLITSTTVNALSLSANETTAVQLNYPNIKAGRHPLTAKLILTVDEDTTNDSISTIVNVGYQPRSMLINEIMYAPQSGMPEWVECVNNSSDTIPVAGWKISDAGATKAVMNPSHKLILPHSHFVITTDTAALKTYYSITAQLFQASFSALNNTGDAVVLFDQTDSVIDSLLFASSWGGSSGGKSLERIDTAAVSTLQSNWKTSLHPLGATPGFINSVTKKEFDVSVDRISVSPQYPAAGEALTVSVTIKNIGREDAAAVAVQLYLDADKDSIFDANEMQYPFIFSPLNTDDSVTINTRFPPQSQGTYWFFAKISFPKDEDTINNISLLQVTVGIPRQGIVINEIMYAPTGDIPEWVEFYNNTSQSISIGGWKISDAGATKALITNSTNSIPPQTYFIVAADSTFSNFYSVSVPVFVTKFSALNNTTPDAVVLFDDRNAMIDSVYYRQSWGGTNGNSLQRFDIFSSSPDSGNWRSAPPSAGNENSIARRDFDMGVKRLASAKNANGTRISVTLENAGREAANNVTVKFFHDANTDSVAQSGELIHSLSLSAIAPLDSVTVQFDWNHSLQGRQTVIVFIEFTEDQRTSNNTGYTTVLSSFPPQAIIINEIMYESLTGNAEFVELLNRSSDTIDVEGWKVMDQPSSTGSRANIQISQQTLRIAPGDFILVASDSSLFRQFPSLAGKNVVINSSLSLNNSGEDIVLVDLTDKQIDSVQYSPSWHLKNLKTTGRSLERINPDIASGDSRNWSSSVAKEGATPMRGNSILITSTVATSSLQLMPNPFSPDNDGHQDFLSINYSLPANSSTIRVRIYDVTGRLVRRLAQNEPASSTGSVIWDGLDDDGHRVRIGMYIILFEALDNFGGVVKTLKDVAVVARKL